MIERALEQIPGRAIVNSVNLEAGRAKLDRVVPVALAHGAALIALTIRGLLEIHRRNFGRTVS